ncbi:MAG: 3'-5' exonuclease [Planctomycetes bacterium]|nr:3'-5' exonuclease [Planctomycetota bacterium]
MSRPLVSLDLETTGLDTERDRIVEVGLVKLAPDGSRTSLQRRMDPGIDIPESATRVHGIRNDDVRGLFGEPPLGRIGRELLDFIGDADLCGFNLLAFDLPLWRKDLARHGLEFAMADRWCIDARTVFLAKEPGWDRFLQGPRNLNNAVLHYCGRDVAAGFAQRDATDGDGSLLGVDLDAQARHSAVKDADATLDVLLAQLARYGDLPRDVPGLAAFCEERERKKEATATSAS